MGSRKEQTRMVGSKKVNIDGQRENILQAVVLADCYQARFKPLTLEIPRCLLPLADLPLIEHTLEFLSLAGVEDVFIFTSTHAERIEEYIRNSKWSLPSSTFKKCQIIMSPSSLCVGDTMRELDAKSMISTDFLLLNGDFVSNMPLEHILSAHRKRRAVNNNAIMTMVLKEADFKHRSKTRGEFGIFVFDETTNRCVYYEELRPSHESRILLPPELLKSHPQQRIRADLIDCRVDICSPDVPALFTENFDYQHIRRDFLHGILTDYDLYGKTVHAHIISGNYAARVQSLQTYDAVSCDIVDRWTYPLCPDGNLSEIQAYTIGRKNIYKEENFLIEGPVKIMGRSVLSRATRLGDNSIISSSVLGSEVEIGSNCAIENSYIWKKARIGSGCKIQGAIIADGASIGDNCTISPGCIISYDVLVPNDTAIDNSVRLYRHKKIKAVDKESDGHYFVSYENSETEDEDEQISAAHDLLFSSYQYHDFSLSGASISTLPGEESDMGSDFGTTRPRSISVASTGSEPEESWDKEAAQSLLVAMEGDHPVEVASLELNSMRMSQNASWHQVRRALTDALLKRVHQLASSREVSLAKALVETINRWLGLIKRCIHEHEDQVDLIFLWQRECSSKHSGEILLLNFCKVGYEMDFLDEEAILEWWQDGRSDSEENLSKVRRGIEVFVKWLEEAEEEGSEQSYSENGSESDRVHQWRQEK